MVKKMKEHSRSGKYSIELGLLLSSNRLSCIAFIFLALLHWEGARLR